MKKSVLLYLVLLLLSACRDKQNPDFMDGIILLQGKEVIPGLFIGDPSEMVISDGSLFLSDSYSGLMITSIDINNKLITGRHIKVGLGPGEALDPIKLSVYDGDLYVYSRQTGHMKRYNPSTFEFKGEVRLVKKPFDLKKANGCMVGFGVYDEGRILIYDDSGAYKSVAGYYPFEGDQMNPSAAFTFYQGYIAVRSNGGAFAFGSAYCDNLEFYSLSDGDANLVKKYETYDVRADFDNEIRLRDDCIMSYKGAYGGEKYCYMLYMGKTLEQNGGYRYWASNIFVFDWEGNHITSYQTDMPILSLCVDEKNNTIYGIAKDEEGEYLLMEYNMHI